MASVAGSGQNNNKKKPTKKVSAAQVAAAGFSALYTLPGGNYDITKTYTASTDSKGHYERVRDVRIPPAMESMILRAVADNPAYQGSVQAFLRDAIIHRLWYISQNPNSTVDPVQLELEVVRQLMEEQKRVDTQVHADVDQFLDTIEMLCGNDAQDMADVFTERMRQVLLRPELSAGHRALIVDALDQAEKMMASPRTRRRRST